MNSSIKIQEISIPSSISGVYFQCAQENELAMTLYTDPHKRGLFRKIWLFCLIIQFYSLDILSFKATLMLFFCP